MPTNATPTSPAARSAKTGLPQAATPYVFAFFMAGIMAFVMCWIIVSVNSGVDSGLPMRVAAAYLVAMPAAFVSVLIVRPIALKLTSLVVRRPG
ncbi:DUF2798 domain-containing protein [Rhizobium sp. 9140]|uniref:DUF2798 domain-containing protein n=1 Tax=Rhizobium sp. 9140 TaxID=1761900 RepID=UPI0007955981|nr:DUF2798 domain-containing protein [Rhizobium sp. 9140]CZT34534.1 Protein of unknown function (DUF2798) [Rhizobium sp. 9140]